MASQVVVPSPTTAATSVEESDFESEAIWKTVSGVIGSGFAQLAHAEAPFVDHLVVEDHRHGCPRETGLGHAILDQAIEAIQGRLDLGEGDCRLAGNRRCLCSGRTRTGQRGHGGGGECRLREATA